MSVERCTLCQTELTMSNTGENGGAHNPRNCAQVLYAQRNAARDALSLAESGLWSVVRGVARGWRIEDRLHVYQEVAKGLGGRYESEPGSLTGAFVGLPGETSGAGIVESAKPY